MKCDLTVFYVYYYSADLDHAYVSKNSSYILSPISYPLYLDPQYQSFKAPAFTHLVIAVMSQSDNLEALFGI